MVRACSVPTLCSHHKSHPCEHGYRSVVVVFTGMVNGLKACDTWKLSAVPRKGIASTFVKRRAPALRNVVALLFDARRPYIIERSQCARLVLDDQTRKVLIVLIGLEPMG